MSESFDLASRVRRPATRVSVNPIPSGAVVGTTEAEPLTRLSDAVEFREAYAKLKSGEWDAGKWQAFRLRYGLYGQLQPNVHMMRIKIPGGLLPFEWAHTIAEARAAAADGADYLGIGPCFPSSTKSFGDFAAAEFLRTVSREISLPAFAIGGVTLDRLDELATLGITRVAVAAAVTGARDPAAAAAAIIDRLKQRAENGDGSDFPENGDGSDFPSPAY